MATIVAITSCPTGIAHTFMAAEGLQQGAEKLGHQIKVETQGSVGAQNQLTEAEIAAADIVLIAADTSIEKSRFVGKRIYETGTKGAITDGAAVVQTALAQAAVQQGEKGEGAKSLAALTPGADQAKPGAHGNHIVVANHGADRRTAAQQRAYRFRRFLLAGFTLYDPFAVERQAVFNQRRAVAADPFGAGQG